MSGSLILPRAVGCCKDGLGSAGPKGVSITRTSLSELPLLGRSIVLESKFTVHHTKLGRAPSVCQATLLGEPGRALTSGPRGLSCRLEPWQRCARMETTRRADPCGRTDPTLRPACSSTGEPAAPLPKPGFPELTAPPLPIPTASLQSRRETQETQHPPLCLLMHCERTYTSVNVLPSCLRNCLQFSAAVSSFFPANCFATCAKPQTM